jgi:hypothetical protein
MKYVNFDDFYTPLDSASSITDEQAWATIQRYIMMGEFRTRSDTGEAGMIQLEDFAFVVDLGDITRDFAIAREVPLDVHYDEDSEEYIAYAESPMYRRYALHRPAKQILAENNVP